MNKIDRKNFTIVETSDYLGIYQDGKLIFQDHNIEPTTLLDFMGIETNYHYMEYEEQEAMFKANNYHMPKTLAEVESFYPYDADRE